MHSSSVVFMAFLSSKHLSVRLLSVPNISMPTKDYRATESQLQTRLTWRLDRMKYDIYHIIAVESGAVMPKMPDHTDHNISKRKWEKLAMEYRTEVRMIALHMLWEPTAPLDD